ncbi:sucrase-isomaltase, intestinal-like [Xenia sp. Carnegie-2017]|uniref:sucrase-isomaltase, intestinal-like n=1 Tax=Xenia sp. Carnegie-2017 TaxID=2897299 RepID=UPI001F035A8E|nr:sucrase-isomaltase, intestinal-like [Xenia sp. Carnegie-2017]
MACFFILIAVIVFAFNCSGVNADDLARFDCYPEGRDSMLNKTLCENRGCLWKEPLSDNKAPSCFYPSGFNAYKLAKKETLTSERQDIIYHLQRVDKRVLYGNHSDNITVHVHFYNSDVLRVKLYDNNVDRYEVPLKFNNQSFDGGETKYRVHADEFPFALKIIRSKDDTLIWDSSVAPLIFSDQYIQISTKLPSTYLYGFGEQEHASFARGMDWKTLGMFSRDQFPFAAAEGNTYGVHPFYMSLEKSGKAHGVVLVNSNAMDVTLQPTPALTYRTIGGILDFYFFLGPSPEDVVQQYTKLIGRPFMPPYWSLGFQLCRYGYKDLNEVKEVVGEMKKYNIPQDVQYGDIDYMERQLDFTYDKSTYDGLPQFVNDIKKEGLKYIIILDPAISVNETTMYPTYSEGVKNDVWIKNYEGNTLHGKVWPNYPNVSEDTSLPWEERIERFRAYVAFPDYFANNTAKWWRNEIEKFHKIIDFDGLWIDMNEPANFVHGSIRGCPHTKYDYPPYKPYVLGGTLADKTICMSAQQAEGKHRHYDVHSLYGWTSKISGFFVKSNMTTKDDNLTLQETESSASKDLAATGSFEENLPEINLKEPISEDQTEPMRTFIDVDELNPLTQFRENKELNTVTDNENLTSSDALFIEEFNLNQNIQRVATPESTTTSNTLDTTAIQDLDSTASVLNEQTRKPEWYKKYPWISYEVDKDACVCFACKEFGKNTSFVLTNWKKSSKLAKHGKSENHVRSMTRWLQFKAMERKKTSVLQQLNSAHQDQVAINRQYLKVIIQSLMYTAQQNVAIRGHEEIRGDIWEISDINRGNFLELLCIRCNDLPWLKSKLQSQLQTHAQWTSPAIQNELLEIVASVMLERIAEEASSDYYGIVVDETADISRTEQLSLFLRYVFNGETKETFTGFYSTKSTEGEVLYELLKTAIGRLELTLENIVAECFDGAANMSGPRKGLAARMKECSPLSIYVHCHGHRLNLALQDTMTTIEPLQKALGVIQSLHNFLEGSPKRHSIFNDIKVEDEDEDITLTIKSQSATRWSCRWAAVKAVVNQLPKIIEVLLTLSKDRDPKTYNDSNSLLNSICDFRFVFGLMVLKVILSNTDGLSRYLQGKQMDVATAKKSVDGVIKTLIGCRSLENFELLWSRAEIIAHKIKEQIEGTEFNFKDAKVPRFQQPSRRLQALVGEMAEIVAEMKSRFEGSDQEVLLALADIVFNRSPTTANVELVSHFYGIDSELLSSEKNVFENIDVDFPCAERENAAKIVKRMFENGVHEVLPVAYKYIILHDFTCRIMHSLTNKRSIVISRSTYISSGKYAGHWLGDNLSAYYQMHRSIVGMLDFNLFGIPYIGADICGFIDDTTASLCQRWMQLGAFYPFSRNHNTFGAKPQHPTVFGETIAKNIRDILLVRYRLLPYLYTLFYDAHTKGSTVVRPLLHEFTADSATWTIDKQFLWGSALLISPALEENQTEVKAYFPDSRWFDYFTGNEVSQRSAYRNLTTPQDHINLHLRGGFIIPVQEPANNTFFSRRNPFGLIVTLDDDEKAIGYMFWDDGDSIDTIEKNAYLLLQFKVAKNKLTIETPKNNINVTPRLDTIVILGLKHGEVRSSQGQSIYKNSSKSLNITGLNWNMNERHELFWTTSKSHAVGSQKNVITRLIFLVVYFFVNL